MFDLKNHFTVTLANKISFLVNQIIFKELLMILVEALWEEPKHRNAYLRNMHKTVTSLNKHNLLKDVERQVFERDELRKLHSDNINLTEKRNTFEDMLSNQHKRTAGIGETDDAIFDRIDYIKKYTEMQSSIKEIITEDNVDNFEHFLKSVI